MPDRLKAAQQASLSQAETYTAERMSDQYCGLFQRSLIASEDALYAS
jgi:hypothetical protein